MSYVGWLVVNSYVKSEKFKEIYRSLLSAAEQMNVQLLLKGNGEILFPIGGRPTVAMPDFVLFWDKDVNLARMLEGLGIPLYNSADAVEICDDKIRTGLCLAKAGIPMPKTLIGPKTFDEKGLSDLDFLQTAGTELGYPMVIKEAFGSFGMQVSLAANRTEAEQIIGNMSNRPFLMQRFISSCSGRDVRINVVGDKAVACMERRSQNGDFRSNATLGGSIASVDPPKEAKELAVRAARTIGLDFAGVDVLLPPDGEPMICEVNSNPHFLSTKEATGVDMAPLILRHIMSMSERHS